MRHAFVAGFVAGEGCFATSAEGRRFAFTVALGAPDGRMCEELQAFFGVGRVYRYARRRSHHEDVVIYSVQARRELSGVVVPFMEVWLPPCRKRRQYEAWRDALDPPAAATRLRRPGAP